MQSDLFKNHNFNNSQEAASALAEAVAGDLRRGFDKRGKAVLAVSGGHTPKLFFYALSRHDLEWERISVTLVDERWVPEGDPRSNARLAKTHLLQGHAAAAKFVPLFQENIEPGEAAQNPATELRSLLRSGFDAVVLGLGPDGHTASFFPGGDNLHAALELSAAPKLIAMLAPGAGEARMTFSASALLRTSGLYLQLEGDEKTRVLNRASQSGPIEDLPIRVFLRQTDKQLDVFAC